MWIMGLKGLSPNSAQNHFSPNDIHIDYHEQSL